VSLVSVLDGATFAVSGPDGDLDPAPSNTPQGLFHADTRFLSTCRLTADGEPLAALALDRPGHAAATWVLAPLGRTVHENASMTVLRRRLVTGGGMTEELEVLAHGAGRKLVRLELALAADFADLFELKAAAPRPRASTRRAEADGFTFVYAGPDVTRTLRVSAEPAAQESAGGLSWLVDLGPGERWTARVAFVPRAGEEEPRGPQRPAPGTPIASARAAVEEEVDAWVARAPALDTDYAPLAQAYERGLRDLAALRFFPDPGSDAALPAAGLPWFMTLFGRDSLIASYQALPFLPDLAATTLRALARWQADADDPARDAEPGKIPHELRVGELSLTGELPFAPYYGTVDATPLWLVLLDEHARWTRDTSLAASLEPHARRALAWLDAASAADGFLRYEARASHGLVNLGWKDSPDSVLFADGRRAEGPIALIEAQGYVIDARRRAARLAEEVWDDRELAARERAAADALEKATHEAFWLPERGCLALALDGAGRAVDSVTSNAGHALWSGAVTEEAAAGVAAAMTGEPMFSGWGVRTMSAEDRGFNPLSYHDGTVWPHDSSLVAAGLARAGDREGANRIAVALLEAAAHFDGRLPEVFAGYDRSLARAPVEYPTASSPQAWAAAAPLLLIRVMLGLEPGGVSDPCPPPNIGRLALGMPRG
jgi:glycogen debranching enzyme